MTEEIKEKLQRAFDAKETPVSPISRDGMSKRESEFVDKITTPACAEWDIWIGKEVEGTVDLGEKTLFVRKLGTRTLYELFLKCREELIERVWFTEEFCHEQNWGLIREATVIFKKVCVCTRAIVLRIPEDIKNKVRIYWKPMVILKEGD